MAEFQFQILIDDEDVGEAEKAKQERMMLSCTFLSRSPLDLSGRRCPSLMVLPVCLSMRISERERERERLEEWKKENRKSIASGRGKTVDCGVDGPRGRASECRIRKSPASLGSRKFSPHCTFISSCAPGPLSPRPNPHSATKAAIWKCKSNASSGRPKGLGKFSVTARQNSGVIAETSLINLPPESLAVTINSKWVTASRLSRTSIHQPRNTA